MSNGSKSGNALIHDALILFAITLVAALALGFVYEITKEPIAAAEAKAKTDAYRAVFPGMESTKECPDGSLAFFQEMIDGDSELAGTSIEEIMDAVDAEGKHLGWVMTLSNSKGYGGKITIALGIADKLNADGKCRLNGIEFLEIGETAGLGMKAKDDSFKGQFDNAEINRFSLAKKGISGEREVDAISSATITTTAVTRMVDAGLKIGFYLTASGALSSY